MKCERKRQLFSSCPATEKRQLISAKAEGSSDPQSRVAERMADPAEEVIKVFKHAISQSSSGLRITSLFGHLAPSQRKRLRNWFMKQYPNPMDHIDFIHANGHHFKYEAETGIITINRDFNPKSDKESRQAGDAAT